MRWLRLALVSSLPFALAGCGLKALFPGGADGVDPRAPLPETEAGSGEPGEPSAAGPFTPWPDWLTVGPSAFAARVDALAERPAPWLLSHAGLADLVDALGQPGLPSTRAAVLLAHAAAAGDEEAREALLVRLERRALAPSRSEAAGDVVAAAALRPHADVSDVQKRLAELASGDRPHPELDVRVECAAAALGGGRDAVVPFLLAVLRAETPAQGELDWPRVTALAWAKSRAADALAARAGCESDFRPDASWQDQIDAAARLEEALKAARALR